MRRLTFLALAAGFAFFLILPGCATKVSGVRQDKSLTHDSIVSGGVAIGGVFSGFEELTDKDKNRNATNLMFEIQEERPKYRVTPMPEVRNAIGRERYEKIMEQFTVDGILDRQTLQELKSKLKENFLVLVRIENDVKDDPKWQTKTRTRTRSGTYTGRDGVEVSASRTIKVTAFMYDLSKAKSVWSGQVTTARASKQFYPKKKDSKGAALNALILGLQGKSVKSNDQKTLQEIYPAPKHPSLFMILPKAYAGFADSLPDN